MHLIIFILSLMRMIFGIVIEIHEDTNDIRNEKYHVLVTKLNSIKQFAYENANDIYSRQ